MDENEASFTEEQVRTMLRKLTSAQAKEALSASSRSFVLSLNQQYYSRGKLTPRQQYYLHLNYTQVFKQEGLL